MGLKYEPASEPLHIFFEVFVLAWTGSPELRDAPSLHETLSHASTPAPLVYLLFIIYFILFYFLHGLVSVRFKKGSWASLC